VTPSGDEIRDLKDEKWGGTWDAIAKIQVFGPRSESRAIVGVRVDHRVQPPKIYPSKTA
jgi:hypothetical protein